ncbi:uncharacterized protein PG986_010063 [Apiospora aurea]|uniref:DUF6604 domain-containing protein n=1 Tax=Apiospora aurea TaxID=335848 RepID=A0ABR1Q9G3_9PEZI
METRDLHESYTRDTRHLIYWLISTSNGIIRSHKDGVPGMEVNTTGQITVAGILAMARLISQHMDPPEIPGLIFYLFRSVVRARMMMHEFFVQLEGNTSKADEELRKSNDKHNYFINSLSEALDTLSGSTRIAKKQATGSSTAQSPDEDSLKELVDSANKFSALSTRGNQSGSHSDSAPEPASSPASQKQRTKSKGKRDRKGKGKPRKPQQLSPDAAVASSPLQVALEDCCFIEDGDIGYQMACQALAEKYIGLRSRNQNTWRDVAYKGLHSAVGAGVSHFAVAMFQQSESAFAIDFPDRNNYQTAMDALTGGRPDQRGVVLRVVGHDSAGNEQAKTFDLDMKEQIMLYAYRDLLCFLRDFQKTYSGRPTKRMLDEIQSWDPDYDLQRATPAQRIKWRRTYTVSWLYDLVNASSKGPDEELFGLNDFAATITFLANNKPATGTKRRILPRHVFQLQCIVDAFVVSRGWLITLRGHLIKSPPDSFRPRRDIDLFMHHNRMATGFENSGYMYHLESPFVHDYFALRRAKILPNTVENIGCMRSQFISQLGESRHSTTGSTVNALSCFHRSNPNGLWEFSPFLCGAGLLVALGIAYSIGRRLCDETPECLMIIHLHNMLVVKGHLEKPVGLFVMLTRWFQADFFAGAKVPTSDFAKAFLELGRTRSFPDGFRHPPHPRLERQPVFQDELFLGFVPPRGLGCGPHTRRRVVCPYLMLLSYRISRTKPAVDPETGEKRLPDIPQVSEAKKKGIPRTDLLRSCQMFWRQEKQAQQDDVPNPSSSSSSSAEGSQKPERLSDGRLLITSASPDDNAGISTANKLALLMCDLHTDVEGGRCRSNLDLAAVAAHCVRVFQRIEQYLYPRGPLSYRTVPYEGIHSNHNPYGWDRRVAFTHWALQGRGDEVFYQTLAQVFDDTRMQAGELMYWPGKKPTPKREPVDGDEEIGKCLDAACRIL